MKFGPVVQEEMLFKEKVYEQRTEGRRTKTDHNSSGELTRIKTFGITDYRLHKLGTLNSCG